MWNTSADEMIETIRSEAKYTASYTGRDKFSDRVMQAMRDVDRKAFVPEAYQHMAYDNGPLSIGHGQTISQPYIVALMTDMLNLTPQSRVLEIGTGSGYQAAILSRVAKYVYTIERVPALAQAATKRLAQLGYHNIEVRCDDGYYGWQDKAPFDAIIVTAAASHIPQSLTDQLQTGGRMIIPVGLQYLPQQLLLVSKDETGNTRTEFILDVAFVPLVTEADNLVPPDHEPGT
ncbi:MAG: protein-L-isoaspartate(D-aspartate) O-methyltransferase [Gammaproteobacteria bacterium]|nr:protein-L-isoaspartate(D-aspartate) O-methyltransferase [Gammaproteobacteria bacterium]